MESLWHYCPVVDADFIKQAGEEATWIKSRSGTDVQGAVGSSQVTHIGSIFGNRYSIRI
jgi:ABC-type taurine transport system substrate-binding protein